VCGREDVWGDSWKCRVTRDHIPMPGKHYADPEIVAIVCSDECGENLTDETIGENIKTDKYCRLEWAG